jgi:hypothetical protein
VFNTRCEQDELLQLLLQLPAPAASVLLTLFGRLFPPIPSGTEKIFSISCWICKQ